MDAQNQCPNWFSRLIPGSLSSFRSAINPASHNASPQPRIDHAFSVSNLGNGARLMSDELVYKFIHDARGGCRGSLGHADPACAVGARGELRAGDFDRLEDAGVKRPLEQWRSLRRPRGGTADLFGLCVDMCVDMCADKRADMRVPAYADMRGGMCTNTCTRSSIIKGHGHRSLTEGSEESGHGHGLYSYGLCS